MNNRLSKSRSKPAGSNDTLRSIARRGLVTCLGVVATSALLLSAAQELFAQQAASPRATRRSVTLITGDRIVVTGQNSESVSIQRAPGREKVRFLTQRVPLQPGQSPHLLVVPEDALPLIAAGRVDRRLFDVTLLIDYQYDDAHRDNLPFIVTYAPLGGQVVARPRVVAGAVAGRDLPSVNGMSITSPKARIGEVWSSVVSGRAPSGATAQAAASEPIGKIWLDGLLRPVLDHSVAQIGAPTAWALGYQGDGVVVAVLDTGVDDTHPDLIDSVVVSQNFTVDPDIDEVGHGTHVASIIAGSGAAEGGRYRGVAPGVSLLSGKVCEGFGCPESSIIAGMQWAVAEEGAQVVNMSLGGTDAPGLDPIEEAVNTLTAQYGALFVIAAGNSGPDLATVESPGATAAALTVGAVDREDQVALFSSRGMTVGDYAIKPDLTAPGVDIVAARAAGTELGELVGEYYVTASGTSMATPHAAGAAALLLQAHPNWRGADVKASLMGSAAFNPMHSALDQGAGRVDIAAALNTTLLANTASLSFGLALWPHEDDAPVTRTVTYRNLGPATELELELDVLGPEGIRPAEGLFTVTPSSIALPEGGTASVRVTANTSVVLPDGVYSGRLIASDGTSRTLAIPLAVNREVESYNLVLRHLDRQGEPTASWFSSVFAHDAFRFPWVDPPGSEPQDVTVRLPKGRYAVESYLFSDDFSEPLTRILAPNQVLDADKLVILDASAAAPMQVVAPTPSVENYGVDETWVIATETTTYGSGLFSGFEGDIAFYQSELEPPAPELASVIDVQWVDLAASPQELYIGAWTEQGKLPQGPLVIPVEQSAVVHASYAASLPSNQPVNEVGVGAYPGGSIGWASISTLQVELPYQRTEHYYSPDPSMRWLDELWMHNEEYSQSIIIGWMPYTYAAGQSYTTQWNQPTFSPVLPDAESALGDFVYRDGDVLTVYGPPMYGDREGHAGFIANEGATALYRNGELVGELPYIEGAAFDVPPEPATYRVELDHSQALFELTPHQKVAWTFESGHVDEGSPARLPLLVVRFTPELDERGRAPSGAHFCLPLYVDSYGSASAPQASKPSVEVSFDDGASWTTASVVVEGAHFNAHFDHPTGARYVSLRTSTHDAQGSAVEQTLFRAYGLSP
jgi:subtilisin family serine protease